MTDSASLIHLYVGFRFRVVRLGKILAGMVEFPADEFPFVDGFTKLLSLLGDGLAGSFEFDLPVDDAAGGGALFTFGPPS